MVILAKTMASVSLLYSVEHAVVKIRYTKFEALRTSISCHPQARYTSSPEIQMVCFGYVKPVGFSETGNISPESYELESDVDES